MDCRLIIYNLNNWETGEGDAITSVYDLEMNLVFIVALHLMGGGNELRVVPFHCDEIRVALHLDVDLFTEFHRHLFA